MELEDDDIELSNKVLNEYLNQFKDFSNLNTESEKTNQTETYLKSDTFHKDSKSESANADELTLIFNQKCKRKAFKLGFMIDKHKISKLFCKQIEIGNQVILKEDSKFILERYINEIDLKDQKLKNVISNMFLNYTWIFTLLIIFSLLLIFFSLKVVVNIFIFIPLFAFVSFHLLFYGFDKNLNYMFYLTQDYLNSFNKLLVYLKEIELISLSCTSRFLIENKQSFDQIKMDSLNYPFRKLVFTKLKNDFNELMSNNLAFFNKYECQIEKSSFVCTIEQHDLSEILSTYKSENEIDKLSDHYSISCARSIFKLNHILLSEMIKLIFNAYIDLVTSDKNIIEIFFYLIRFNIDLFKSNKLIKNLNSEIASFSNICHLIKDSCIDENTKLKKNIISNQDENYLAKNLRNALLIVYDLMSQENNQEKLNRFKLLKVSMEYCDLYFKQLKAQIEGENKTKNDNLNEVNLVPNFGQKILSENNKEEKASEEIMKQIIVDEIYEADTFSLIENNENNLNQDDDETSIKEKKENYISKNLMYELKYALKSKKNEWKEREKNAKRTIDENSLKVLDHLKTNQDEFDDDHLLDNEQLKYKSKLRKRRQNEFKCDKKYTYVSDEVNENNKNTTIKFSLLSELINKRSDFLLNNRNEEGKVSNDDKEEIIS